MEINLQITIKQHGEEITQDIMTLYRNKSSLKNLGLTLSEGKALVASVGVWTGYVCK